MPRPYTKDPILEEDVADLAARREAIAKKKMLAGTIGFATGQPITLPSSADNLTTLERQELLAQAEEILVDLAKLETDLSVEGSVFDRQMYNHLVKLHANYTMLSVAEMETSGELASVKIRERSANARHRVEEARRSADDFGLAANVAKAETSSVGEAVNTYLLNNGTQAGDSGLTVVNNVPDAQSELANLLAESNQDDRAVILELMETRAPGWKAILDPIQSSQVTAYNSLVRGALKTQAEMGEHDHILRQATADMEDVHEELTAGGYSGRAGTTRELKNIGTMIKDHPATLGYRREDAGAGTVQARPAPNMQADNPSKQAWLDSLGTGDIGQRWTISEDGQNVIIQDLDDSGQPTDAASTYTYGTVTQGVAAPETYAMEAPLISETAKYARQRYDKLLRPEQTLAQQQKELFESADFQIKMRQAGFRRGQEMRAYRFFKRQGRKKGEDTDLLPNILQAGQTLRGDIPAAGGLQDIKKAARTTSLLGKLGGGGRPGVGSAGAQIVQGATQPGPSDEPTEFEAASDRPVAPAEDVGQEVWGDPYVDTAPAPTSGLVGGEEIAKGPRPLSPENQDSLDAAGVALKEEIAKLRRGEKLPEGRRWTESGGFDSALFVDSTGRVFFSHRDEDTAETGRYTQTFLRTADGSPSASLGKTFMLPEGEKSMARAPAPEYGTERILDVTEQGEDPQRTPAERGAIRRYQAEEDLPSSRAEIYIKYAMLDAFYENSAAYFGDVIATKNDELAMDAATQDEMLSDEAGLDLVAQDLINAAIEEAVAQEGMNPGAQRRYLRRLEQMSPASLTADDLTFLMNRRLQNGIAQGDLDPREAARANNAVSATESGMRRSVTALLASGKLPRQRQDQLVERTEAADNPQPGFDELVKPESFEHKPYMEEYLQDKEIAFAEIEDVKPDLTEDEKDEALVSELRAKTAMPEGHRPSSWATIPGGDTTDYRNAQTSLAAQKAEYFRNMLEARKAATVGERLRAPTRVVHDARQALEAYEAEADKPEGQITSGTQQLLDAPSDILAKRGQGGPRSGLPFSNLPSDVAALYREKVKGKIPLVSRPVEAWRNRGVPKRFREEEEEKGTR